MKVVERSGGVVRAVKLSDIQSVTARAKLLAAGEVGQGPTVAENWRRGAETAEGEERGEGSRREVRWRRRLLRGQKHGRAEVVGGGEEMRERERWREEREEGSERGTRAGVWS